MAYGTPKYTVPKTVLSSRTAHRRGVSKKTSAKKRFAASSKARLATVPARKAQIRKNSTAIRSIRSKLWGPVQSQSSTLGLGNDKITVRNDQPLLFQLNNPVSGVHGPATFTCEGTSAGALTTWGKYFQPWTGRTNFADNYADYQANDNDHVVNGPSIMLKSIDFQFRFTGFLDDCRAKIQIIRQKKMMTDWWDDSNNNHFLPHSLTGFRDLCGFTANRIDLSTFEVLATKYVYINSRGQKSIADTAITAGIPGAATMDTAHSTTTPTRLAHMHISWNRVVKQLHSSVSELSMQDDQNVSNTDPNDHHGGGYKYRNIHPLANVWVLISCDDTLHTGESALSEDKLRVEIIRKCTWQDRVD